MRAYVGILSQAWRIDWRREWKIQWRLGLYGFYIGSRCFGFRISRRGLKKGCIGFRIQGLGLRF